jgi:hypothetical protein
LAPRPSTVLRATLSFSTIRQAKRRPRGQSSPWPHSGVNSPRCYCPILLIPSPYGRSYRAPYSAPSGSPRPGRGPATAASLYAVGSMLAFAQATQVRDRFGTPCYVYDRAALESSARPALAFPAPFGFTLRYAMKANPSRGVLAVFRDLGLHIDASSRSASSRRQRPWADARARRRGVGRGATPDSRSP